jgi:6,7-dimethyl-8-ribityllumazine synthase
LTVYEGHPSRFISDRNDKDNNYLPKIAIVVSKFNEFVTEKLLEGALDAVDIYLDRDHCDVFWVPGAFELPLITQKLAASGSYDCIVCLGAVIKGETQHFDYVCSEAAAGIRQVSIEYGIPVGFGLLTTFTPRQAMDRAGGNKGNKGYDATKSTIEILELIQIIEE